MIIGECNRPQDIVVNICKTKRLTNMRSSTADVMVTLQAPKILSLEEAFGIYWRRRISRNHSRKYQITKS